MTYQQIELFGKDLPDHIGKVRLYTVSGLDEATAVSLENRAARIITLGRRAILEIGNELLAARKEAAHGTWGAFLARCGLAERTAQNYISVAERFGERPDVLRLLPPTALYALASESADPAVVERIIARAQSGQTPTVAEVQEQVRKPRQSWLYCAECNAAVKQLYGARGVCRNCWQAKSAPAPEPEPEPDAAPMSEAETWLIAAQHAAPGSHTRLVALRNAAEAMAGAPSIDQGALRIRYGQLQAEHDAQSKWKAPVLAGATEPETVTLTTETGAHAARLLEQAATTPSTSVQPAQPALPADIPADIVVWAAAYGLSALPAEADDGEPAFHLCWPGENPAGLIPFNVEWAREWLSSDAPDLVTANAPQSLYCRALAAGLEIVGADRDGRLAVAAVRDPGAPNSWLTPAELESRLGSPPPRSAPSRADMAQWVDLCDQATNSYGSGDGAHALRCLWQMATIAAGSVREAREWATRNSQ